MIADYSIYCIDYRVLTAVKQMQLNRWGGGGVGTIKIYRFTAAADDNSKIFKSKVLSPVPPPLSALINETALGVG